MYRKSLAQGGHIEIYKYIGEFVEDMNPAKNDGTTPLHEASKYGFDEIVKYILQVIFCLNGS